MYDQFGLQLHFWSDLLSLSKQSKQLNQSDIATDITDIDADAQCKQDLISAAIKAPPKMGLLRQGVYTTRQREVSLAQEV